MKNNKEFLRQDSKVGKWVDKVVDKEFSKNEKKYLNNGSFRFGACATVAKRLEKSFNMEKDPNKKTFLSQCVAWLKFNVFD